ncbi:hypothetical protein TNCV_686321 [Trichonephila clavipes]|nr:hypothetical protein TNCV_686321 [Trichonephila clavipes]
MSGGVLGYDTRIIHFEPRPPPDPCKIPVRFTGMGTYPKKIFPVANPNNPHEVLGPYHSSALRPCIDKEANPVMPLRKRGRPRKDNSAGSSSRTKPSNQRGSVTNGNRAPSPGRMDK